MQNARITNDLCERGDDIDEKESLTKMFNTGDKSGSDVAPGGNSESVRRRIDSYKENRRKELLERFNSHVEAAAATSAKPFKASKRREDLRGGGCATAKRSQNSSSNNVPSSDSRRYISRRDQNKTDGESGSNGECQQQSPVVRETRTSRLRAANRTSAGDAGSPRSRKTPDKEKSATTSSSASSTTNSLNRKEVDKSYKRKSYLNRSHTSEEVQDIHLPGDPAGNRRRSSRSSMLDGRTAAEEMPTSTNKVEVPKILSNGTLTKQTKTLPFRKSQGPDDRSACLSNGVPSFRKQTSVEERKKDSDNEPRSPSGLRRLEERFQPRRPSDAAAKSFVSADNSPARRTKQNPDDFARRADLLAAATLKMINRLDEINKSNRRVSEDASSDRPWRSVAKTETKKVPEENTAKSTSSSILNQKFNRPKIGTPPTRQESPKKVEVSKPSILKKKMPGDASPCSSDSQKSKPVSILKRKSLSQDESHSKTNLFSGPPVTFSPNVTENENPKRQGILKKRRSLDENEVLRRRSGADSNNAEFKPILKNQRRSSLEDLGGRSRSPDYLPQSILKRKSSRDEEPEEAVSGAEPQGILKRKNFVHVKISDSVIMAAAANVGEMPNENIRPILKKKSSSEEHSTPELSASEPPRPILKKPSVEVDDMEEKPKKPILKTSRKTSLDDSEDGKRCEAEPVKPILKRDSSRSGEDAVVMRRPKPNRFGRPLSSSDIDDELHAIFHKRRSLEFQIASAVNLDWQLRRAKSVSLNDRIKGEALRRPSSVAEKVNTLESFLQMERERDGMSPSPPRVASPRFRVGGAVTHPTEPAFFRFPSSSGLSYANGLAAANGEVKPVGGGSKESGNSSNSSEEEDEICLCTKPSPPVGPSSLVSIREATQAKSASSFFTGRQSCPSTDSEVSSNGLSNDQDDSDYLSAVESCSRKFSSLDVNAPGTMEEAKEVAEEIFLLQKSGSVTAKASLFQEMEKKFKAAAEEEKTKPSIKGASRGMNRYREKKLLESSGQKYHTQPVSSQDVEEAIRNARNCSEERSEDG
ncbi:UNVERIFIED_CONTAM: hypothetical protein PYX00_008175 [Menopon gallinae]|uniref:Supervillin n=1 Tax=Menopon gallinae TaxID=328185 RepID=A0AAW2HMB4_9NEOP